MDICEKLVFKQVFDNWNISIQRFLISRGLGSDDAADLMQDCFVRLWNNCSKVKFEQVGPYMLTMAKNISIDHFRKQQVRLKHKQQITDKVEKKDGQYLLEEAEFKDKLERAIDTIPALSKEVFIMHRFNNMSYKDIAKSLEISVKAVEKRMHKALAHLYNKKILRKK